MRTNSLGGQQSSVTLSNHDQAAKFDKKSSITYMWVHISDGNQINKDKSAKASWSNISVPYKEKQEGNGPIDQWARKGNTYEGLL